MTHWNPHWSTKAARAAYPEMEGQKRAVPSGAPMKPQGMEQLLTTDEAALVVRLSRRTLERLRVTGGGPVYIKLGRGKRARVAYREADLKSWLEASVFRSTAEYER